MLMLYVSCAPEDRHVVQQFAPPLAAHDIALCFDDHDVVSTLVHNRLRHLAYV